MSATEILMLVGFAMAGYAIVANDAIQTLGTFIASNARRPWWLLWLFASSVMVLVVMLGWYVNQGDPAFGRLDKFPLPQGGIQWFHLVPPVAILLLTRYGVPVSTTFLVLAVFNPNNIGAMLLKSVIGYLVAFMVAIVLYRLVIQSTTAYFDRTRGAAVQWYWVVLQWLSTAFLWSQWLIQDLANIFAYLPRELDLLTLVLALLLLVLLQGAIFFKMGGAIQRIVSNKTGTADVRAATIIDLLFACILLVFKEWSSMPMSTTWVFLGLLAGRQVAISLHFYRPPLSETSRIVASDAVKALFGLLVSVILALGLPSLLGA